MNFHIWIHMLMNSYMNIITWIHKIWIHIWIWHYEFMVSEFMYMNSENTMNSYMKITLWIHVVWIHVYEFRECYAWIQGPWIHSVIFIYEFILYEFKVTYSYMNSWKLWIHIWISHYEFICYEFIQSFIYEFKDYEFIESDSYMNS